MERSVRVVVRARPPVADADGSASVPHGLCACVPDKAKVRLQHPADPAICRQWAFDSVLDQNSTQVSHAPSRVAARCVPGIVRGATVTHARDVVPDDEPRAQEDLYEAVRVREVVDAVLSGFHATVLAYGQTGSGKTYSMEGYRYQAQPGRAAAGPGQPSSNRASDSSNANVTSTHTQQQQQQQRGGQGAAAPQADFAGTPPQQLGLVPRAVQALFEAIGDSSKRAGGGPAVITTVRVSFVQLYKEQVYDLLNAGTFAGAGPGKPRAPGGNNRSAASNGLGKPLHLRWSKAQEFYLENLFMV